MLWVQDGEALWQRAPRAAKPVPIAMATPPPACAAWQRVTRRSMRAGRPLTWPPHQPVPPASTSRPRCWRRSSRELLALESFVGHQSRGLPVAPPADPRLVPFAQRGAALFSSAWASSTCPARNATTERAGLRLGGSLIPQGHATGYPIYRLEWQGMGSLQRRIRNCMTGVRAEPFAYGAPEMVALELYLATRARACRWRRLAYGLESIPTDNVPMTQPCARPSMMRWPRPAPPCPGPACATTRRATSCVMPCKSVMAC
jgi:sulfur-oxidizing protein SoxA